MAATNDDVRECARCRGPRFFRDGKCQGCAGELKLRLLAAKPPFDFVRMLGAVLILGIFAAFIVALIRG